MNRYNNKKIISIILVLIILISHLGQISWAGVSIENNKGIINISNIEKGVKVSLYQLATTEFDYTKNQPKEGYIWNSKIQQWVDINYPQYSNSEDFYNESNNNSGIVQEFYDKLTKSIKTKNVEIDEYATKEAIEDIEAEGILNSRVQFTEVDMGTYLVIIENGYMVYTPSVVNVFPKYDNNEWNIEEQEVVIKSTKPQITQTVTDLEKLVDNYSINDEIIFTIQADVPKYLESSLSKKYCISDKIDKSLEIIPSSVIVTGSNDLINNESVIGHTIQWNKSRFENEDSEKVTFKIDFNYSDISQYDKIQIQYKAKLKHDSNLVVSSIGNNNHAYLDYSNNPYEANSIQSQNSNQVTVYTYQTEIKSTNREGKISLPGSEFSIRDEEGNDLYFIEISRGEYYLTQETEPGATNNLVVDEEGKIYLYGFDEGIYQIKQNKAPEGYTLSSRIYSMDIKDANLDGVIDYGPNFLFPCTKGFILPLTGSKTTIILVTISIILLGSGITLFISKKK